MKKLVALLLGTVLAASSLAALAHSGGTDQYNCHTDHSTGVRHCH